MSSSSSNHSTTNEASDSSSYSVGGGLEIPNLRPVDDFLLDRARFETPPLNDLQRWNNRIISNLLYYQTNYIGIMLGFFVLSTLFNALDIVVGLITTVLAGVVGYTAFSTSSVFHNTRRDHPYVLYAAVLIALLFLYYCFSSVLVLAFTVLLPLVVILIHASIRLRNFRSKVNQQAEKLGLKRTVMSRILEIVGCDVRI